MTGGAIDLWKSSVVFRLKLSSVIWNWLTLNSNIPVSYTVQKVSIVIFLLVVGLLGSVLLYKAFHRPDNKASLVLSRWIILFAISAGLYIVIYFLAFALTTPPPDLYERIASPIYISVILMIFGMIYLAIEIWQGKKWLKWLSWMLLVILVTSYLPKTIAIADAMRINGDGYTSRDWRESPLIQAIQQMPESIPIVTDEPAVVLFLTGRDSIWVTEALGTLVENPQRRYGETSDNLGELVFRNGGALVLFDGFYWRLEPFYGKQTQDRINAMLNGLTVYKDYGHNSGIYFYEPEYVP